MLSLNGGQVISPSKETTLQLLDPRVWHVALVLEKRL